MYHSTPPRIRYAADVVIVLAAKRCEQGSRLCLLNLLTGFVVRGLVFARVALLG